MARNYKYLGKTAISYVDEVKEAIKKMVEENGRKELMYKYFNDWGKEFTGSSATNREDKLNSKRFGK